jgi:hypothetical protein
MDVKTDPQAKLGKLKQTERMSGVAYSVGKRLLNAELHDYEK